jgi:hypothetical protein
VDDFNPYAAPEIGLTDARLAGEADEGRGVWRDGETLVMVKIARLPARCVKCNEPATYRLGRKLYWHHPALYFIILAHLFIYVIVALIVRKTAKIEVPLCEAHRAGRTKAILFSWIVALSGIALCFAPAISSDEGAYYAIPVGVIMVLFSLIFGMIRGRVVTPKKIDDTHVWLKKVSPLYLAELPSLPYSDGWEADAKPKLRYDEL